jgi:uncharacterized membrane protein
MKNDNVVQRAALATAAAILFAQAPLTVSAADAAKVKCEGVNACKGQSACHTAQSACAGQNACKGKGFLELTKAQCEAEKQKQTAK